MSRTIRTVAIALAMVAMFVGSAYGMPIRDRVGATGSPGAGLPLPGPPTWPEHPAPIGDTAAEATAGGDGASEVISLATIVPGIVIAALLAGGIVYAVRGSSRTRRARARA